jgi:hypothetical protein
VRSGQWDTGGRDSEGGCPAALRGLLNGMDNAMVDLAAMGLWRHPLLF